MVLFLILVLVYTVGAARFDSSFRLLRLLLVQVC